MACQAGCCSRMNRRHYIAAIERQTRVAMAVYTEVSDADVTAFVAQYDIGDVQSCKGIAEGIENSNFLLTTDQGPFILTLYEKRVKRQDLPFYLGLMRHLSNKGIPCPTPIIDRQGHMQAELCNRPAAIVSFRQGMWPRRATPGNCAALGAAMARMHLAGDHFPLNRDNDLSLSSWRPLLDASRRRVDEVQQGLAGELDGRLDALEAEWPSNLPTGVIHADLFPDNVFFRGDKLTGLIDFYFACTDFFVYDLAICLNAWCFEVAGDFNITKARRLLAGYVSIRPLSGAELNALPILARGAAMRFLLTRLYDWLFTPEGALVTRKDPLEYLKRLRFHGGVQSASEYGLD
jgi:homoserine kinase type II